MRFFSPPKLAAATAVALVAVLTIGVWIGSLQRDTEPNQRSSSLCSQPIMQSGYGIATSMVDDENGAESADFTFSDTSELIDELDAADAELIGEALLAALISGDGDLLDADWQEDPLDEDEVGEVFEYSVIAPELYELDLEELDAFDQALSEYQKG